VVAGTLDPMAAACGVLMAGVAEHGTDQAARP
jgi:hypothetical protein